MKKCLLLFMLLLPKLLEAQTIIVQNIAFGATNLVPLTFTYTNINQVLNGKQLDVPSPGGAIKLMVCSNNSGATVKAHLTYDSGPSDAPLNWMKKTLVSDTYAGNQTIVSNINLNGAQQFLLHQPTAGTYYYYYNIALNPLTTFVPSGEYGYTIHYTMTTP